MCSDLLYVKARSKSEFLRAGARRQKDAVFVEAWVDADKTIPYSWTVCNGIYHEAESHLQT